MTPIDEYVGRCRRRCAQCGVEVDLERPNRVIGRDTSRAHRQTHAVEVRRQILWEATCEGPDGCRAFWNAVLRRIEAGPQATG